MLDKYHRQTKHHCTQAPRLTQQDPPSSHPSEVLTSGFPSLRLVLSAGPPPPPGLCPVLPSTLSVAVLPPGQVWGRGRSGPSMPFHGGSITHPLTSILSHRPGGLTGGDSAPETSVVSRTWKSGIEQVVWLHTLQYPEHPTEGDPPPISAVQDGRAPLWMDGRRLSSKVWDFAR